MKKIFTLLVGLGAVTGVFAQRSNPYADRSSSHDVVVNNGDRNYNDGRSHYDTYNYSNADRDLAIQRINRDFDARVRDIQYNRWMRPREKDYQIRSLEGQRRQQIEAVKDRFQNNRNGHDNDNHGRSNGRW